MSAVPGAKSCGPVVPEACPARYLRAGRGPGPRLTWRQVFVAGPCGGVLGLVTEQAALSFGGLLRKLRAEARLMQEELPRRRN